VKGLSFDWHTLHTASARRRLSLPSYPFARERHWVQASASAPLASALHPLLERNTSQLSEQRFSTRLTGEEFFLSDHVVHGERVLPAAAYVEMARAGLERSVAEQLDASGGWEFEQLLWVSPVVVGEPREVHLALEPVLEGEGPGPWVQFEIYSGAGEAEQVHARGRLRAHGASGAAAERLDVGALGAQSERELSAEQCYEAFARQGIRYGAGHRALRTVSCGGQGEERYVLARLELPDSLSGGAAQYELHPSVLDGALQAVLGLRFGEPEHGALVPFAMRRVRVYGPSPRHGFVYATAQGSGYTLKLCDPSGELKVLIEGFTLLPLKGAPSTSGAGLAAPARLEQERESAPLPAQSQAAQHGLLLLSGEWQAEPALPKAAPAQRRVLLSSAYEGSLERLRELAPQVQFGLLSDPAAPGGALTEGLHRAAEQLLEQLGMILKGKPRSEQLLQVVCCAAPAALPVGTALSAMLASATQENPKLKGQVLLLEHPSDAQHLWESLERNARSGESLVRESAGLREVWGYRLFDERPRAPLGAPPWKDGGVYLISGGAGGLGLIFAEQMLRTARSVRVILSGRSPVSEALLGQLERLRASGAGACVLEYEPLDVSDRGAVQRCVRAIEQRHGALSGVLHGAGVIRDSFIINKTAAQLHEVLTPKLEGLVHLDEATQGMGLDCFILFSSVAGALGNVGQADYALANAFMDGYAHYRNELVSQGLRSGRTLSVNWPLWLHGGMSVAGANYEAMRRQGIEALSTQAGVVGLQEAWSSSHTQVLVLGGDSDKLKELLRRSLGAQLREGSGAGLAAPARLEQEREGAPPALSGDADRAPEQADREGLKERLERALVQAISRQLKVRVEEIDVQAELSEFGFDSISFTQFSTELNERYGLSLSPTVFFEYPSVERLAGYLCAEHGAALLARLPARSVAPSASLGRPLGAPRAPLGAPGEGLRTAGRRKARRASAPASAPSAPIAIIGMSARFPGARDVEQFWNNLQAGTHSIEEIPASRWDWRAIYGQEANQTPIKWGGFIEGVDEFDALFFGISPAEAQLMDPQQRLLLEHSWKALEDAGYAARTLAGSDTGVFIGTGSGGYGELLSQAQRPIEGHSSTGAVYSVGPNRLSYLLDLHGPSEPVETACSSSLVAIHRAVRAIRSGDCQMALVGGVNTILTPWGHISFNKAGMLSEDGLCKSFSQAANGYVRGEGVGILVLKGLAAAERDGDHIYGVIRGSAENHGGRANSLTAPNPQAQAQVIKAAVEDARIDARTLSYIEAHGTGTALGDPIEIQGLKSAFAQLGVAPGSAAAQCGIGSVKSNIGHLEIAAGVAGLIKVLLQFKHRRLVKSLHCEPLNPYIELQESPFYIVQQSAPWRALCDEVGGELPRRAGISSFGFGGVNAHVIVEEYVGPSREARAPEAGGPVLVVLSARSEERLRASAGALLEHLKAAHYEEHELADVAYTLQVGREAMESRLGFTAQSFGECVERLEGYLQGRAGQIEGLYVGESKRNRDTLALFAADEELQSALGGWVSRGKYEKLLELWVKGLSFDWHTLHTASARRRLSLPSYPFARERHWVQALRPLESNSPIVPHNEEQPAHPAMKHDTTLQRLLDDLLSDDVDVETATKMLDSMLTEGVH
jgi:polyketide synthase PksN